MLILLLAAGLRLWNLADHGFGNIYYAAAVRSMAGSWHNFLYASFDPAGFLMLDKPPFAFWVQALCVKLFGFNGLSLHLPQVIEGVAAVLLVYVLTRRVAGEWAGLIAAVVMALTPASVAVDRSNLPDSCLVVVLLLAAWVLLRAASTGSGRRLALSMALVGVAFGVKMIAALVVLPAFYLTYWLGAPLSRKRRMIHLCGATAVVFGVSLSWPLLVDLTPAHMRPYVGDTQNNSALSLAFGMFGVERFTGQSQPPPSHAENARPARNGGGQDEQRLTAQGGRPGPLRLANRDMAGHITWMIPLAVVGFLAVARVPRPRSLLSPLLCGTGVSPVAGHHDAGMPALPAELVDDVGRLAPVRVDQAAVNPHHGAVIALPLAAERGVSQALQTGVNRPFQPGPRRRHCQRSADVAQREIRHLLVRLGAVVDDVAGEVVLPSRHEPERFAGETPALPWPARR
ncbi:MAG: glycosyltransferase family 39 protein [Phycisphaerae bacterium]|nr:glycosyltransferase family 39 protein [Phycisphaerae bacterium]